MMARLITMTAGDCPPLPLSLEIHSIHRNMVMMDTNGLISGYKEQQENLFTVAATPWQDTHTAMAVNCEGGRIINSPTCLGTDRGPLSARMIP